jgi:hypothetical protein
VTPLPSGKTFRACDAHLYGESEQSREEGFAVCNFVWGQGREVAGFAMCNFVWGQ